MNAATEPRDATSLRGAQAQPIGHTFWRVVGTLVMVVFASIVTVSFISAANDNARIGRLKSHGVSVQVSVTGCVGNIGGSGSNAAGYTCRGSYRVDGVRYVEVIGSKSTLSDPGSIVRGVADPQRPNTVELASAVASSSASSSAFLVPGLLTLLWVALAVVWLRRRHSSRTRSPDNATP
jgi:hypothetical protein